LVHRTGKDVIQKQDYVQLAQEISLKYTFIPGNLSLILFI